MEEGDQAEIERALKNLKSADALMRESAASALGLMDAKEYAKDVAALLKDEKASVRSAAARALGQMRAKEHAKDVAALLNDANVDVCGSAAEALGKLISKDEKERVECYAKQVGILLHDTRQCLIYDCAKKEWKETTVSAVAEQVLEEWGLDPEKLEAQEQEKKRQAKIEKALEDLKSANAYMRMYAALTVGEMEAKEYARDVAALLKDEDDDVREAAARALGVMQVKEYAKHVAALLKDEKAYVRGNAARALAEMQAKEYAEDVAVLLKDAKPDVRGSAAWVLGKLISKDEKEAVKRYGKELAKLLGDTARCSIYDFAEKEWKYTTVSEVAEQVLKEWGLDPEKLKDKK